jgi:hypothetical protein
MVLVGKIDEIFSESGQNFNEDIHLPARAPSVATARSRQLFAVFTPCTSD